MSNANPRVKRSPIAGLCLLPCVLLLQGATCAREPSPEERLDRSTETVPVDRAAGDLTNIQCEEAEPALANARAEKKTEPERLNAYMEVFRSFNDRASKFEQAIARNPDLAYQEGSDALLQSQQKCVEQRDAVRRELDRYLREIIDVPTVQEIKGGKTVTVARLDFEVLRTAVELLNPDDKELLLEQIDRAQDQVEAAAKEGPKPPKRKRRAR